MAEPQDNALPGFLSPMGPECGPECGPWTLVPAIHGRILPIVEARATYVFVAWSADSGYTEIQVPTSALPSSPTPGPTMLVGFNADGSYTLYRPLPQARPVFGGNVVNQLPVAPNGTTEVVVPEFI